MFVSKIQLLQSFCKATIICILFYLWQILNLFSNIKGIQKESRFTGSVSVKQAHERQCKDTFNIVLMSSHAKFCILLDSITLKGTSQARNHGVLIDSDMKFNNHLKAVTKFVCYHLQNMARIKSFLSREDKKKLVHAFIFIISLGLHKKSIRQLKLIQNRTKNSEARTLWWYIMTVPTVSS